MEFVKLTDLISFLASKRSAPQLAPGATIDDVCSVPVTLMRCSLRNRGTISEW